MDVRILFLPSLHMDIWSYNNVNVYVFFVLGKYTFLFLIMPYVLANIPKGQMIFLIMGKKWIKTETREETEEKPIRANNSNKPWRPILDKLY